MEQPRAHRGTSEAGALDHGIEHGDPESRRKPHPHLAGDLHVCPGCASDLVHPIAWEPAERKRWSVTLRCPECQWTGGGVYGQSIVDRFDEALDRGTEQVLRDLKLLVEANAEEEIDRFAAALAADQVLPEDF